ncbi:hypothetical protein L1887_26742 [Cichorium endivia]|nr:hypothetical protein L1887_26742 [Cichorium endivia]
MCGRGVMEWLNGDLFDGSWLNGYRHGSGVYRFSDSSYYFGTWTKGLKDGQRTFYPSGSKAIFRISYVIGYTGNDDGKKFVFDQDLTFEKLKNDDDVKIVVGNNFEDIVLDESKDVLLEDTLQTPYLHHRRHHMVRKSQYCDHTSHNA